MTTLLRKVNDFLDSTRGTAIHAALLPPAFILMNAVFLHVDPRPAFYDASSQIGAALLLAFIIENGRVVGQHQQGLWAVSLHAGMVVAILESLTASLWAIARGDGSVVLAALTISGLFWGLTFLAMGTTAVLWRSAAVAGAFGEDEVVGGGEGGGEGAEEDGVGAEG